MIYNLGLETVTGAFAMVALGQDVKSNSTLMDLGAIPSIPASISLYELLHKYYMHKSKASHGP